MMIPKTILSWMKKNVTQRCKSTNRRKRTASSALERLEDRTVLASTITILDVGVGTLDLFLSATDGTIDAGDGGAVPGTVSRAALQTVNATTDISITAQTSIIVNDLASPLTLLTDASHSATFTASAGSLTFNDTTDSITTAGGRITLTAFTSAALGGLSTSGGQITVNANDIALQAAINAGAGVVLLRPSTAGRDIDLGTETAGKLSLTQAELNNVISTGVLRIGDTSSGTFVVSAPINANAPIVRAALVLISAPETFALWMRPTGLNAALLFALFGWGWPSGSLPCCRSRSPPAIPS